MYGVVSWGAHCSLIMQAECVAGTPNEGCELITEFQCMNHARG
jgi:hypothetical protein